MKKMKKLLMAVGAFGMLLTSCQNDLDFVPNMDETSTVSFQIGTPEIATRAYSDGMTATVLQYAVYDSEGNILSDLTKTDATINGSTTVNLQLTTGDSYAVIFWAAAEGAPYTVDFDKKTMTVSYDGAKSNDEARDAFYKYHTFTVTGAQTETIELKRPFAQLNIGTNDFGASESAGYVPTTSAVTVKNIYNTLNLVDGVATGETQAVFEANTIPEGEQFPVSGYEYLAMNYLLVNSEKEVVDVEFTYADANNDAKTRTVGSVPVQRNHRTNIYGQLLTSDVNINVEILPEYEEPNHSIGQITDGVMLDSEGIYHISNANGWKWLAEETYNGNTFGGKIIKLDSDINLALAKTNGDSNAPIGSSSNNTAFSGTLDGNGHTISNLYQSGWDLSYDWYNYGSVGLFAQLDNATVKNVTLEGFEGQIEGGDIAFVAGSATGDCIFENIEIKNGKIGTYNNGIGSIIGWSGAGNYTFRNIKIGADVVLGGLWGSFDSSVGGIVGQAEAGASYTFDNVEINCRLDVYNDCTASYDYYLYRMCGMIIGRCKETTTIDGKNYPDLSKYNISCTNVTVNYGDWMNYHYCEPTPGLNGGRGMRVEPGYAYDGLPADFDHTQCTTNHMTCIPFDGLFGGDQLGVNPIKAYEGVTVNYPFTYNQAEVTDKASLDAAIKAGQNVKLATDIDFGTTQLVLDNVKIDLNGKTLTTQMAYGGISLKNGASIKNGTIEHTSTVAAIKAFNVGTIEDVTIKCSCTTLNKVVTGIAVQQGGYVGTIKNVHIEGASQCIEVPYQATVDLIENVSVEGSTNGTAVGQGLLINGGKVVKAVNSSFKGDDYGVQMLLKGVFAVGLELVNCNVTGTTASIYAWDEKGISNTSGSLTLTYDAATTLNGPLTWDFEDECLSVVTLNKPN